MLEFFETISLLVKLIARFGSQILSGIRFVLDAVITTMNVNSTVYAYIPTELVVFAVCGISITAVLFLIGR